ncbi:MAG: polysaccharide deacetylase family protein [Bradyrhizobiaceae bacterium]|nr:polysaccharide deacetylase family protein [Bradyrhizobiaceae bacterium]
MTSGWIRWLTAFALAFVVFGIARTALAEDCPGNPGAIGTSRTIVVDPTEHPRIGGMSYAETLPLADKEVVLTFDDGPIEPYSSKILDILASECVHATYFVVGDMVRAHPELVQRELREGHTVGTHSMTHPYAFRRLRFDVAKAQIDDGIAAASAAVGDPKALAPFFRFPGFERTDESEDYLAGRGMMVWGADFPADDWMRISDKEIVRRALMRIQHKGKGILLLHDIHPATVRALPMLLKELKARGYHIVHVVPASEDRPKTETVAEAWQVSKRPKLAMPVLTPSDVQNLSVESVAQHFLASHLADLCSLKGMTTLASAGQVHPPRFSAAHLGRTRSDRFGHWSWPRWY